MTAAEKARVAAHVHSMGTETLKEMAGMMERKSVTERQTLAIIQMELIGRNVRIENIPMGIEDAEEPPPEERPR